VIFGLFTVHLRGGAGHSIEYEVQALNASNSFAYTKEYWLGHEILIHSSTRHVAADFEIALNSDVIPTIVAAMIRRAGNV
jgi:hypothetical protein